MKRIILTFSLFIFTWATLSAQDIMFNQKTADLGEVQYWSQSPAFFIYTNNSSNKLSVLRVDSEPGLRANFKIRYLQPGESDTIIVFYIPKEKGAFHGSVDVFFNTRNRPVKLKVSGIITGLDECPGSPVIEENKNKWIKTIDKESGKPVSKVRVETFHMNHSVDKNRTRLDGMFRIELKPSLYHFSAAHPDYHPFTEDRYIRISEKVIVLELERKVPEIPVERDVRKEEKDVVLKETDMNRTDDDFELVFEEEEINDTPPKEPVVAREEQLEMDTVNKNLPTHLYKRNNIVFLIDVSSSMRRRDRMPLLKKSMFRLFDILRPVDDVSLITYSSRSQVLLERIPADEKTLLYQKVDSIEAKGMTYGVIGLTTAYELAEKNFIEGANNQVIIATDGQFNSPDHGQFEMMNLIRSYAAKGVSLSIIGFGDEGKYLRRMKSMARIGKGNFIHISGDEEVDHLLIEEVKKNSRRN